MDQSLDEIINSRDGPRGRGRRGNGDNSNGPSRRDGRAPRRDDFPRDGIRKSYRDNDRDMDRDWVHDKFDDDQARPAPRARNERYSPGPSRDDAASREIRAENLHYDLTETDLRGLFSRMGQLESVRLLYDRQDRSQGVAYITYTHPSDARDAVHEFDGANAMGQPLRLTLTNNTKQQQPARNPFDYVEKPVRSLFDRIGGGEEEPSRRGGRNNNARSASPRRDNRRDDIDRYVPNNRARGSRSPRRRAAPRETGRAPGARREERPKQRGGRGERGGRREGGEGRSAPRPRKTAEELDAEMDSYWGPTSSATAAADGSGGVQDGGSGGREAQVATASQTANPGAGVTSAGGDDDIDLMVE